MMENALDTPTADTVQLAEDEAAETGVTKSHGRLLTPEEWAKVLPPFYYIKVNFDQWGTLEYDIAVKFIVKNGTGWLYYNDKKFVFEKEDDYILFRMWAENKPMQEDDKVNEIK